MSKKSLKDKDMNIFQREYFGIEHRTDITDDEKVKRVITRTAIACAVVAMQPIPFADIFVLTPMQAIMGSRIAAIRGVPISIEKAFANPKKAFILLKEISFVVFFALIAQQFAIISYKTILHVIVPFFGSFTTIIIVFPLAYAIGRVMDFFLIRKARSQLTDPEILKGMWKKPKKSGKDNT